MISKKDLKDYEYDSIEQYYDMLVESKLNGQFSQLKEQIKELSPTQKKDAIDYLDGIYYPQDEHVEYVQDLIIKSF